MFVFAAAAFAVLPAGWAAPVTGASFPSMASELSKAGLDRRFDASPELPIFDAESAELNPAFASAWTPRPPAPRFRVMDPTQQALAHLSPRRRRIANRAIPWIDRFGVRFGVYRMLEAAGVQQPRLFVLSLIETESGFNPEAASAAGARGLMQVMPRTAQGLGLSGPLTELQGNIRAGMGYLAHALSVFGRPDYALAAYCAGIARVRRALAKRGRPPMVGQARNYVHRVLSIYLAWAGSAAAAFAQAFASATETAWAMP